MTLPNFLVIGAARSATTSLHHVLRAHRDVFVPKRKEPNFFAFEGMEDDSTPGARRSITRLEDYARLFDAVTTETSVGEVSPAYLRNARACERIHYYIPDVRLIAVLRNPIERAYSDFLMRVREGLEPYRDFGRAIAEEEKRFRDGHPGGHYVRTGFYGSQLKPYFETFGAERIQVHLFEDLVDNPGRTLASLFRFLGVRPDLGARLLHTNLSGIPRGPAAGSVFWLRRRAGRLARAVLPLGAKQRLAGFVEQGLERPPLLPEHRERLAGVYGEDVRELEGLLGRSLGHWLA
jgi:sulfotransferase family protein